MILFAYPLMALPLIAATAVTATAATDASSPSPLSNLIAVPNSSPAKASTSLPQSPSEWICAAILIGISGGLLLYALYKARKSPGRDDKELTAAQLGVIAVAVGTAFGFGGAMLSTHDPILDLIVAAVTSVLVIQLAETLRTHHLSKRMQSLERALDSETTYSRLDDQLNDLSELSILLRRYPEARPLFDEFLDDAYNGLADSLESLAAGTINVEDPARELTFNKDCLEHLAHKEVWAVSYQDGTFWDDPEGKDFLSLHDQKVNAGVVIHRIFLLTNKELIEHKAIIESQMAKKIKCRILLRDGTSGKDIHPEDFVIYDEAFVRAANLVAEGPTTTLKRAVLSCDARKVRHYLQKRNDFKTRSEPAENVFKRAIVAPAKSDTHGLPPASSQATARLSPQPNVSETQK